MAAFVAEATVTNTAASPTTLLSVTSWSSPLGIAAGMAVVEKDAWRLRSAAAAYVVLAVLHAGALVRFHTDVRWGLWGTWAYLAVLASMVVAGVAGLLRARAVDASSPGHGANPARCG